MIKAILKQVVDSRGQPIVGIFTDVRGGREPGFSLEIVRGQKRYWHESGYGYLPETEVRIV